MTAGRLRFSPNRITRCDCAKFIAPQLVDMKQRDNQKVAKHRALLITVRQPMQHRKALFTRGALNQVGDRVERDLLVMCDADTAAAFDLE